MYLYACANVAFEVESESQAPQRKGEGAWWTVPPVLVYLTRCMYMSSAVSLFFEDFEMNISRGLLLYYQCFGTIPFLRQRMHMVPIFFMAMELVCYINRVREEG